MTTPDQRTHALKFAGEFLDELTDPKKTPNVPDSVRQRALHILRHYPSPSDIAHIAEQCSRGALILNPMLDSQAIRSKDRE